MFQNKQHSLSPQLEPCKGKDQPSSSQTLSTSSTSLKEVQKSPIQFEMPKDAPKSVKAVLLAVRLYEPSHTFRIAMDPEILDSDQYLFISPEDVIHLGTMTEIGAPCITFWIR